MAGEYLFNDFEFDHHEAAACDRWFSGREHVRDGVGLPWLWSARALCSECSVVYGVLALRSTRVSRGS